MATPLELLKDIQKPHETIPLLDSEISSRVLLSIPGLYRDNPMTYEPYVFSKDTDAQGVHTVRHCFDPCSFFHRKGNIKFEGYEWPTKQHILCYSQLKTLTGKNKSQVRLGLLRVAGNSPTKAILYTNSQIRTPSALWEETKLPKVAEILIVTALQESHFMQALLTPKLTEIQHVTPEHERDQYWYQEGQNMLGRLMMDTSYSLRSLASYIRHYERMTAVNFVPPAPHYWGCGVPHHIIPAPIRTYIESCFSNQGDDYGQMNQ